MHTGAHTGAYTQLHTGGLRSEHAYIELKTRLLAGEFRLGARLRESKLAAALGVSRTPIREALLRLQAEGLVTREPDGGCIPVVPDVASIRAFYEVRAGLELQGLRRGSHDMTAVASIVEEWRALADDEPEPGPSFVLVDESFHVALAHASGNAALADVLTYVNERIRSVRTVDFLTSDRIASTIEEHIGIAVAVLAGDMLEAEQQFLAHLDKSQYVVEQRVAAAVVRMARAPELGEGS